MLEQLGDLGRLFDANEKLVKGKPRAIWAAKVDVLLEAKSGRLETFLNGLPQRTLDLIDLLRHCYWIDGIHERSETMLRKS